MTDPFAAACPVLLEPGDVNLEDTHLLVHVAEAPAFEAGHVPGAVHVAPVELIDGTPPATGRLPPLAALEALFRKIGYDPDQPIVVYDDEGGGWAGRFGWTLDVIGHERWGYLNGGIHAWLAHGLPVDRGPGPAYRSAPVDLDIDQTPIAEIEDVLSAIDDPAQALWDVRSREEYLGQRLAAKHGGHIPGAIHLDWMDLKNPEDDLRLVPDLQALLEGHGLIPDKAIITHCQTHHRSGLSYLVARLLGYPNIRAYHGSWSEWGNRDDLPITCDE